MTGRSGVRSGLDRLAGGLHAQRWWWYGAWLIVYALGYTGLWVPIDDAGVAMVLARQKLETGSLATPLLLAEGVHPGYANAAAMAAGVLGVPHGAGPEAWDAVVRWLLALNVAAAGLWLVATHQLATWALRTPALGTAATLCCAFSALMLENSTQTLPDTLFAAALAWWLVALARLHRRPGKAIGAGWGRRAAWVCVACLAATLMLGLRTVGAVVLGLGAVTGGLLLAWRVLPRLKPGSKARGIGAPLKPGLPVLAGAGGLVLLSGLALLLVPGPTRSSVLGGVWASDVSVLLDAVTGGLRGRLTENVPRLLTRDLGEALAGSDLTAWGNAALALAALAAAVAGIRRRPYWAVLTLGFVLIWCVFLSTTRYVLPLLPPLVVGLFDAADRLDHHRRRRRGDPQAARAPGWAGVLVLLVLLIGNLAAVVNVLGDQIQRRRGRLDAAAEAAWYGAQAVRTHRGVVGAPGAAEVSVFPGRRASALMWWGRVWAVPRVPYKVWDQPPRTFERGQVWLELDASGAVADADPPGPATRAAPGTPAAR